MRVEPALTTVRGNRAWCGLAMDQNGPCGSSQGGSPSEPTRHALMRPAVFFHDSFMTTSHVSALNHRQQRQLRRAGEMIAAP